MSHSPHSSLTPFNGLTDTQIHIDERYRVISFNEDCLIILGEQQRFLLRNPAMIAVMCAVKSGCKRSEIVKQCCPPMDMFQCEMVIDQLIAQGYLTEQWPSEEKQQKPSTVSLHSYGDMDMQPLQQMLDNQGIKQSEDACLQLLVVEDYLQLTPEWIAKRTRNFQQPALLVKPGGTQPLIGPLLKPDDGPCPSCLQHWIRQNRPVEMMLARQSPDMDYLPPSSKTSTGTAYGAALHWVERFLSGDPTLETAQIVSIELQSNTMATHHVQKRPQCEIGRAHV